MRRMESAKLIAGLGVEGDSHVDFEHAGIVRHVLLMDEETLEALALSAGEVRENITTSGLDMSTLHEGRRLALGEEVVLEITGNCAPCARMDEIRPGLRRELADRRGKLAGVARGGTVRVGDAVRILESAAPS